MRTTAPVVLAVLIALSGILTAGGISVMKAYTPATSAKQTSSPINAPTTTASSNSVLGQQQPATIKLTQQPQNNQTCTGDDCSHGQGDD